VKYDKTAAGNLPGSCFNYMYEIMNIFIEMLLKYFQTGGIFNVKVEND
jgi:hypothetical protein